MATGAAAAAALSSKFKVEAYVYTMVREVAEAAEEVAEAAEEIKATVWLGLDQQTGQSMVSWWRSGDPTPWHGGWVRNPLEGTRSLLVEFNCRGFSHSGGFPFAPAQGCALPGARPEDPIRRLGLLAAQG